MHIHVSFTFHMILLIIQCYLSFHIQFTCTYIARSFFFLYTCINFIHHMLPIIIHIFFFFISFIPIECICHLCINYCIDTYVSQLTFINYTFIHLSIFPFQYKLMRFVLFHFILCILVFHFVSAKNVTNTIFPNVQQLFDHSGWLICIIRRGGSFQSHQ